MVAMYSPFWPYMLDSRLCICMVGLSLKMSLSGLHSCVLVCKLVILRGDVCIFYFLFVCGWYRWRILEWLVVLLFYYGIVLYVVSCVLIECHRGVGGPPPFSIVM